MKLIVCVVSVAVGALPVCLATSLPPFYHERVLVDRVAAFAKSDEVSAPVGLEILERTAEGRVAELSPTAEAQVGLEPGQLHKPEFANETVRAHALRKIGEVNLPGALRYLQGLKKSDIEPNVSGQVWLSAQIALRVANLIRLPNEPARIQFLEDVTTENSSDLAGWAADELCDRGSISSLRLIRQYYDHFNPSPKNFEESASFCEARMAIMQRDSDRVKALGSFLSVSGGETNRRLVEWAIAMLDEMSTPAADTEIDRYAHEIDALPDGTVMKEALRQVRLEIRNRLPHHPK